MNNLPNWLVPAVALSLPLLAVAQQGPSPSDPAASAPALRYQSAFADYKSWRETKPGNWRQSNDNVAPAPGASGGHSGHGVASPAPPRPAAPEPSAAASTPAPAASQGHHQGHQGHQMPGGKP